MKNIVFLDKESSLETNKESEFTSGVNYLSLFSMSQLSQKIIELSKFKILNKETSTTSIICKKSEVECNDVQYNFEDNYVRIKNNLFTNSNLKHYLSIHPYYKILKKMIQYPREFFMSFFVNDHKKSFR